MTGNREVEAAVCETCGAGVIGVGLTSTNAETLCRRCWQALPPESCNPLHGHAGPCGAPDCVVLAVPSPSPMEGPPK